MIVYIVQGKATLLAAIEKKNDPCKAALTLMDELFTVEEMSKSCFKAGSDRAHSTKKPPLDEKGVQLIYGMKKQATHVYIPLENVCTHLKLIVQYSLLFID